MKLILSLFLFAFVNLINAQNSYLYTKDEKILIKDWEGYSTNKNKAVEYARYNGENKGSWYKNISIEKVDSITVEDKVTYIPLKLDVEKKVRLYKTLISSPDKKVLISFYRSTSGNYNDEGAIYYIVDNNMKVLERGYPTGRDNRSKLFASLKRHFAGCESVLESIKHYESLPLDYNKLEWIPGPYGLPYQKKVFHCN